LQPAAFKTHFFSAINFLLLKPLVPACPSGELRNCPGSLLFATFSGPFVGIIALEKRARAGSPVRFSLGRDFPKGILFLSVANNLEINP